MVIFVIATSLTGETIAYSKQEDAAKNTQVELHRLTGIETLDYQVGVKTNNEIWVFSDPSCIHCRRLHAMLGELNNVTVHVHILANQKSTHMVKQILCSTNPLEQWDRVMREKELIGSIAQDCLKNNNQTMALAKAIGIESTPAIINSSGFMLEGVPTVEFLKKFVAN